nr:hypothetical protein Iba_chr03bCG13650 [Ipomoea batatas]
MINLRKSIALFAVFLFLTFILLSACQARILDYSSSLAAQGSLIHRRSDREAPGPPGPAANVHDHNHH